MVTLEKRNTSVSLSKEAAGLDKVTVGLGWDPSGSAKPFDLDACAFLLGPTNSDGLRRVTSDADFIFYNQKTHPSGSVTQCGDNRTGQGDGDDEMIKVNLSAVPQTIDAIDFVISINDYAARNQNFGMVKNSYVRILDDRTGNEIVRYNLETDFTTQTALIAGEICRDGSDWKFVAVGAGVNGGLGEIARAYGVDVG
jgi:tellurium resistance protein TerD